MPITSALAWMTKGTPSFSGAALTEAIGISKREPEVQIPNLGEKRSLSTAAREMLNHRPCRFRTTGPHMRLGQLKEGGTWYVKSRRYSGGSWGSTIDLYSGAGEPSDPQIASGNNGSAVALWRRSVSGYVTVEARLRSTEGVWGTETALSSTGGNTWWPRAAMNDSGEAAAIWYRYDGANTRIQSRILTSESWNTVSTLSEAGQNAEDPRVGIDNSGRAAAVWRRFDGKNWRIQGAQYVSGTWGVPSTLSASGQDADSSPWIAVSENGKAITMWTRKDSDLGYARGESSATSLGSSWDNTESWSSVAPSAAAVNPNVAMADSGRAVGGWQLYNSSLGFFRIYAADRFF